MHLNRTYVFYHILRDANKGLQIVVVRIPAFARISALVGAGRLNYLIQPCANPLAGRMKVLQARNYVWL